MTVVAFPRVPDAPPPETVSYSAFATMEREARTATTVAIVSIAVNAIAAVALATLWRACT